MAPITSHQPGISSKELEQAVPDKLLSKDVHLHWVDRQRSGDGLWTLSAKIVINGQVLLLYSKTNERILIDAWDVEDPTYHTNARLLALERILTDPANEDLLLSV
jgi:hypothetical protein